MKRDVKRSQHELRRLVEEACAAELNIPRPGLWLCVDRVEVVGRSPERVRAWATLHFLPGGTPFCCGEPGCHLQLWYGGRGERLSDHLRRAMGLRHEVALEFVDIGAHYHPGVRFDRMTEEPMDSEYLRRPDAKGHLKVMECLRKWDPIGVISSGNQDEYDGYAAAIVRLLDAGISEGDLFEHMKRIVSGNMGISCDKARTMEIARELVQFWRTWKGEPSGPPGNSVGG